jgi:hypothetical protein
MFETPGQQLIGRPAVQSYQEAPLFMSFKAISLSLRIVSAVDDRRVLRCRHSRSLILGHAEPIRERPQSIVDFAVLCTQILLYVIRKRTHGKPPFDDLPLATQLHELLPGLAGICGRPLEHTLPLMLERWRLAIGR